MKITITKYTPHFDWLNQMRIPITWNDLPSEIVADSLSLFFKCYCN